MWTIPMLRVCFGLLLLALSPPIFGHLSFNLVVDEQGNAYFLDIFRNSLVKIAPDGEVSELVDLHRISTVDRPHALALGQDGRGERRYESTGESRVHGVLWWNE